MSIKKTSKRPSQVNVEETRKSKKRKNENLEESKSKRPRLQSHAQSNDFIMAFTKTSSEIILLKEEFVKKSNALYEKLRNEDYEIYDEEKRLADFEEYEKYFKETKAKFLQANKTSLAFQAQTFFEQIKGALPIHPNTDQEMSDVKSKADTTLHQALDQTWNATIQLQTWDPKIFASATSSATPAKTNSPNSIETSTSTTTTKTTATTTITAPNQNRQEDISSEFLERMSPILKALIKNKPISKNKALAFLNFFDISCKTKADAKCLVEIVHILTLYFETLDPPIAEFKGIDVLSKAIINLQRFARDIYKQSIGKLIIDVIQDSFFDDKTPTLILNIAHKIETKALKSRLSIANKLKGERRQALKNDSKRHKSYSEIKETLLTRHAKNQNIAHLVAGEPITYAPEDLTIPRLLPRKDLIPFSISIVKKLRDKKHVSFQSAFEFIYYTQTQTVQDMKNYVHVIKILTVHCLSKLENQEDVTNTDLIKAVFYRLIMKLQKDDDKDHSLQKEVHKTMPDKTTPRLFIESVKAVEKDLSKNVRYDLGVLPALGKAFDKLSDYEDKSCDVFAGNFIESYEKGLKI